MQNTHTSRVPRVPFPNRVDNLHPWHIEESADELVAFLNNNQFEIVDTIEFLMSSDGGIVWEAYD